MQWRPGADTGGGGEMVLVATPGPTKIDFIGTFPLISEKFEKLAPPVSAPDGDHLP